MGLHLCRLCEIAYFVTDKIPLENVLLTDYVTTDSLLPNKEGRCVAQNLPPQKCVLTHYKCGDVLVANIRPYLKKIWFADREGGASADVLVFRAKSGHSQEFLYASLLQDSFYDYVMKGKKGSKMPRGDKAQIMRYSIPKLSLAEEACIGNIILSFCTKININRQINDNLEAMAKQLYDYWFVQFDFPNEEGKPYKSSGGAMVWNEKLKREIPVGWSVKNLGQIATSYQQGLIRSNNQLSTDSKYGYLKMGDLDGKGQYTLQGLTRTNATNEEVDLYSLHKGDFLINVRNSKEIVGKTCLIGYVERNTLYNHMLVRLDFKDVSTFYMNLLFNSEFMYKALDGLKQGTTTVIALYQSDLYRLPILIPAPCVMERFLKITDSILDQKEIISHEIAELTKQRNELLPLLMNGQATVNYHLSTQNCFKESTNSASISPIFSQNSA